MDASDFRTRLAAARHAAAAAGLDALLITPGADLRYLTGYHAHQLERLTCLVLPAAPTGGAPSAALVKSAARAEPTLIVPTLERPAAEASPASETGVRIVDHADGTDPYPLVTTALGLAAGVAAATNTAITNSVRSPRIGLSNRMWAEQVLALRAALPDTDQRLAGTVLAELRIRKSDAEIEALARAGAAIDAVHARMGEWLRPGRTEAEVAADIAQAIREVGHATADFTIVASGPNSASPHHGTSDRVIQAGEPVVVDIGGTMPDGYCSDSTRTYVIGAPARDFLDAYAVLYAAQRAAVDAVRPGVTAEAVDAAARDVLTNAGLGPYFLHRTGHGIGLDGHEEPYIVSGNGLLLEPGMTFSIEPGFYVAGRFGARIEDIVACTGDGVRRLNTLPTDLVRLDD